MREGLTASLGGGPRTDCGAAWVWGSRTRRRRVPRRSVCQTGSGTRYWQSYNKQVLLWYPVTCGKHCHHSVVIRNFFQCFIVIVSEHSVPFVCTEVTSLTRNRQGMTEVTLEIKQLQ